ncbi:MAG: SLC13 family permease [Oscillospiraceae bacterium]|nr:SLC13 family permease [Oscillospiraceae bacterium]
MIHALVAGAAVLAVAVSCRTRINIGFPAMLAAWLIGCWGLGMTPAEVIGTWPVSIMFVVFAVSLFYNFAMLNGTLETTARWLLYAFRGAPRLLPYALYAASAVIGAMGAGYFAVMVLMIPITLLVCRESGRDPLVGVAAVNCGAQTGGDFMISGNGVVFRELIAADYGGTAAFGHSFAIFAAALVFSLLLIGVLSALLPGEGTAARFGRPAPYTPRQRLNLILILLMMAVLLAGPVLQALRPGSALAARLDAGLVAILFAVLALALDLAPQDEAVARIPWNIILMVGGVGMFIQVAIRAGSVDALAALLTGSLPAWLLPPAFALVGAVLSGFSSLIGVVCPALFPLVPTVSAAAGLSPAVLYVCIIVGAHSATLSPFCSGGGLVLGACSDPALYERLYSRLLKVAVPVTVALAIGCCFVLSALL